MVEGSDVQITDGVSKAANGVGWYCKVCDCFLKDSMGYLDHINGKKHQRALGYTMRVEQSTVGGVKSALERMKEKKAAEGGKVVVAKKKSKKEEEKEKKEKLGEAERLLKEQEDAKAKKWEEKKKKREEKRRQEEAKAAGEGSGEEEEGGGTDLAMAAMMGFSGFK